MTSIQHKTKSNLAHFCGHIISNDGQTCGEAVAECTGDITLRLYRPLIDASYVLKVTGNSLTINTVFGIKQAPRARKPTMRLAKLKHTAIRLP